MNIVDLIIAILLILGVVRGARVGLARQFLALVGFFGGLFLGALLARELVHYGNEPLMRLIIVAGATLGMASIFSSIGEVIGMRIRRFVEKRKLTSFDGFLGSALEITSVLVVVWLLASVLTTLPLPRINDTVSSSQIVRALQSRLPPAPSVIASLKQLIDPNGFPGVFVGPEPNRDLGPPPTADVQAALDAAGASTVKVEGLGCGGVVDGSGFVAQPGYVITNAHVIAGIRQPTVKDRNGTHSATPVWFDAKLDMAVLRTSGLAGKPLPINTQIVPDNTPAVVLGYPGGGSLRGNSAVVLDNILAVGRDIYNSSITTRDIYELNTIVEQGNSGGPLVTTDGTVIGLIFAKSVENDSIGYALTTPKIAGSLRQAIARNQPVGTGSCASE